MGSSDYSLPGQGGDAIKTIAESLKRFDLVVATGGIGSFTILNQVYNANDMGLTTTLFVPASVENEFLDPKWGREDARGVHAESIGADTAANTGIEAVDRLREQSYLSKTVFVIQCVGLKSNFLPIQIGAGCGAHRIYLPPYPALSSEDKKEIRALYGSDLDPHRVNMKKLAQWIGSMFQQSHKRYLVVIVPNGIPLLEEMESSGPRGNPSVHVRYEHLVASVAPVELTLLRIVDNLNLHFSGDPDVQIRYIVLDDLQRGGDPSLHDRILGTFYGQAAIEEFLNIVNAQHVKQRGDLNLLSINGSTPSTWSSFRREEVIPLYEGDHPRGGGLDSMPFFRQSRGTVSGYRPFAAI